MARTLRGLLRQYVLYRSLKPDTAAWYARIVGVYCEWAGRDVPLRLFDGKRISRMLAEKQAEGRSTYYCRSLRSGLVALLREHRGDAPLERVRSVKTAPLEPEGWTAAEVERLLQIGCSDMPEASRLYWQVTIALGYYSGLDACDLWRIDRRQISAAGVLLHHRSKTGKPIAVQLPADLIELIDRRCRSGLIVPLTTSREWFRRTFAGIVRRAGLSGSFKRLRKTSGTLTEAEHPGSGQKHLGNTRAIFERHYQVRRLLASSPTMPPRIRMPRVG
jgi:hypothetical protein